MSVALKLLVSQTEASLAAETNPKKKLRLERDLASFKLTAMRAEGGDDEGDEDDEDDDGDDDSKAKKAKMAEEKAKKSAEAAKHRAKAAEYKRKMAEAEEDAEAAEADEESEADTDEKKASRAARVVRAETPILGMSDGAAAALSSQSGANAALQARVDKLEKENAAKELRASIAEALSARRITPGEAKTLSGKSGDFVRDFLAMRPKAIVNTDESAMSQPSPTENADIPAAQMANIDAVMSALPANLDEKVKAKIRQDMINGRRALAAGAGTNGAAGRY